MNIFCKWHFLNASKEVFWKKQILNFMHGFKNAILAIFPFCQNGTFESLHGIKKNLEHMICHFSVVGFSAIQLVSHVVEQLLVLVASSTGKVTLMS